MPILNEGGWNGRGVEISVECDARQPVAAVAEPLSAVAAGDLFGPEGGYGAGARFLESLLEGEETVLPVSSMDAGDEELLGVRGGFLEKPSRLMRFDVVAIQFSSGIFFPHFFTFL